MAGGMNRSLEIESSQFDPIQLVGTQVPFVDPFSYDVRAFQTIGFLSNERAQSMSLRTQSCPGLGPRDARGLLAEEPKRSQAIELDARSMPLQRVPSIPPAGPATFPEPAVTVAASASGHPSDRIRLTSEQAIHIYNLGRTKTAGTAALLAIKYNISAKPIREIWTRKSWAQDTRPNWID